MTQYIRVALRWAWLVLLAALLAGSIAYFVDKTQPPLYDASARLIIGPGIAAANPDLNDMRAAAQLMWTYSEFVTTPTILQRVIDELDLPMSIAALRDQVSVSPDQTTLWLTIRVRSSNGQQAVVIANALANALVEISPSNPNGADNQTKATIDNQIQKVQQELIATEAKLAEDQVLREATTDNSLQSTYEMRITQQQSYIVDLRNTLASLYSISQETYTNQVTIIEAPTTAQEVDSNTLILIALAGLSGMIAALAIVFAFEYFGNEVTWPAVQRPATNRPNLGGIDRPVPVDSAVSTQQTTVGEEYKLIGESHAKPTTGNNR